MLYPAHLAHLVLSTSQDYMAMDNQLGNKSHNIEFTLCNKKSISKVTSIKFLLRISPHLTKLTCYNVYENINKSLGRKILQRFASMSCANDLQHYTCSVILSPTNPLRAFHRSCTIEGKTTGYVHQSSLTFPT